MNTYFAPAERANDKELFLEIEIVSKNPILEGLLHSISGLLAIVNEQRQIVALNDSFMQLLGINDPEEAFGLRHGQALQCIHADDEPDGCGTTKFCSTCGAAIAIVASIDKDIPAERLCALTVNKSNTTKDIALLVRSHPVKIDTKRFILLFIQDITRQQQRAALERTFFHDVNNLLIGLVGASELAIKTFEPSLINTIHQTSLRLKNEVSLQSCLARSETCQYQPLYHEITIEQVLKDLQSFYLSHPAAQNKTLQILESGPTLSINTDISIVMRVLCNMVTNALEATVENGYVKIWVEQRDNYLSFHVWNSQSIAEDIARRVFQRNFSTKEEPGRGIGTYSMKLFGEEFLGGLVDFKTSFEEGTEFIFSLPNE